MDALDLNHIIGPFSRVIEFDGLGAGFYLFPHNDDHIGGWGKPYTLPDGTTVPPPGTPIIDGGTAPFRRYAWDADKSAWVLIRLPGDWLYGNIDWRGPVAGKGSNDEFREKLSFHGPQSRYFASPTFVYGSDPKHNEIYYQGDCADIAPYPVLGAAYTTIVDPDTEVSTDYIVVVCKKALEDWVFIRPKQATISPGGLTEEVIAERKMLFEPGLAPEGWRLILLVDRQSYTNEYAQMPDTPWFFSENGREAQCMRRTLKEFDNGQGLVTEGGLFRYKINIQSATTASFVNLRNTSGFTYKDTVVKESFPHIHGYEGYSYCNLCTYAWGNGEPFDEDCGWHWGATEDRMYKTTCNWSDSDTYKYTEHVWGFDHISQDVTMEGDYHVAVDYWGNQEILVSCRYDFRYTLEKYFRYNIDNYMAEKEGRTRDFTSSTYHSSIWCVGQDYLDPPMDGARYGRLSWYDSNGNIIDNIDRRVCEYNGGYPSGYPIDGAEHPDAVPLYFSDIGVFPPDTAYTTQGQLGQYSVDGRISLRYKHPLRTETTELFIYWNSTEGEPRSWYGVQVHSNILHERRFMWASVQHLDVRPKEGTFGVFRTERMNHTDLGVIPYAYADVNLGAHPYFRRRAGTNDHDYYYYAQRADIKEEVTYEYIDPFIDPELVQLIAREEGTYYESEEDETSGEKMGVKVMRELNPLGADHIQSSIYEPVSNVAPDFVWTRNDFDFVYQVLTVDGHCPTEQEYTDAQLEPHFNKWLSPSYGYGDWPKWSTLLGQGADDIVGGFGWQDKVGVCFSIQYKTGNGSVASSNDKPVTEPVPDALKVVEYANYVTNGNLDDAEPPADRFYPIGVE